METVNVTQAYVDRGYLLFKEKRSELIDPNEFPPDLILYTGGVRARVPSRGEESGQG